MLPENRSRSISTTDLDSSPSIPLRAEIGYHCHFQLVAASLVCASANVSIEFGAAGCQRCRDGETNACYDADLRRWRQQSMWQTSCCWSASNRTFSKTTLVAKEVYTSSGRLGWIPRKSLIPYWWHWSTSNEDHHLDDYSEF